MYFAPFLHECEGNDTNYTNYTGNDTKYSTAAQHTDRQRQHSFLISDEPIPNRRMFYSD